MEKFELKNNKVKPKSEVLDGEIIDKPTVKNYTPEEAKQLLKNNPLFKADKDGKIDLNKLIKNREIEFDLLTNGKFKEFEKHKEKLNAIDVECDGLKDFDKSSTLFEFDKDGKIKGMEKYMAKQNNNSLKLEQYLNEVKQENKTPNKHEKESIITNLAKSLGNNKSNLKLEESAALKKAILNFAEANENLNALRDSQNYEISPIVAFIDMHAKISKKEQQTKAKLFNNKKFAQLLKECRVADMIGESIDKEVNSYLAVKQAEKGREDVAKFANMLGYNGISELNNVYKDFIQKQTITKSK